MTLRINRAKSAVAPPSQRNFLGFSFTGGAAPRRRIAPQAIVRSRNGSARRLNGRGARASKRSSRNCRVTSSGGAATSASARRLRCCAPSISGSGAGFAPSSGSNGSAEEPASRSCAAGAWLMIWRRKPPAALTALGGSATAPRSPSRFQTTTSAEPSASLPSPALQPHNRPNRRVRTRTHGGVGGEEPRGSPLSRLR